MQQCRQDFLELNNGLKQYPYTLYQLKTNKMVEVLDGGNQVVSQYLEKILSMEPMSEVAISNPILGYDFSYNKPEITVLGDESGFFGNSKGTFLKAALFHTIVATYGTIDFNEANSTMFHSMPLPNKFTWSPIKTEPTLCPYFAPEHVTVIHSGYAFGGHRNEVNHPYPPGKPFGPEDCSSFIAKNIKESSGAISTIDLLRRFRYSSENKPLVSANWDNSLIGKELQTKLEPVKVCDPQTDICPGMVYCHRTFPGGKQLTGEGSAGHAAQVVGFFRNKVVTLGYNRDMPKLEGFGIQEFPISDSVEKQQMFFKVK
jgi:hypothetical protein